MMARGKLKQVVVTAIARELAGFVWATACTTSEPPHETAVDTSVPQAVCPEAVCPGGSAGGSRAPRRQPLKRATRRARASYERPGQTGLAASAGKTMTE